MRYATCAHGPLRFGQVERLLCFSTPRVGRVLGSAQSLREVGAVTEEIRTANPTKRFGHPDEFGATCAFLCSAQAGYITGQNILIDMVASIPARSDRGSWRRGYLP